jgi:hypothetical protein
MYGPLSFMLLRVKGVGANERINSGREVFGGVALVPVWRAHVMITWELIRVLLRLLIGSLIL